MAFRILGLSPEPFVHLYGQPDDVLTVHGAIRCVADAVPGFPDRVELRDAEYVDEVPEVLQRRPISLRGFDARHMMLDADLVDGRDLGTTIERLFADPRAVYLQAHFAKRGCYAARVERAAAPAPR